MLLVPGAREPFMPPGAPDSTLLAFIAADWILYAGGSFVTAYGVAKERKWAWGAVCVNAGAAVYAALYGVMVPIVSGGGWLGALFMLPSLVVMPMLVWVLRPEELR